jgi:Fe-S cluster biosynthesis and repair protein YggX
MRPLMKKTIFCAKLKQEASPMDAPPFPGSLGERIVNEVSQQAWNMWLSHQTMLINEYRLSLIDPKSREFLRNEMVAYFFGQGSEKPSGFQPTEGKTHDA